MRNLKYISVILILLASSVSSQVPDKPFDIYLGAGLSVPVSGENQSEQYNTGFHGMGGIGFNINPFIGAILKLEYHSLSRNWSSMTNPNASGGTLQAVFGGADLRLSPSSIGAPLFPYLFGGVGVAMFSVSDINGVAFIASGSKNDSKVYFNIGAGLEFYKTEEMSFFVQGSYVSVAFDEANRAFVPLTVGIKF